MKRQLTYLELKTLNDDIEQLEKERPGVAFLLEPKLSQFKRQNAINLRILKLKPSEIKNQYCLKDADNNPVIEEVDGKKLLQYPDEDSKDKATVELTEFFNRTVTVEL